MPIVSTLFAAGDAAVTVAGENVPVDAPGRPVIVSATGAANPAMPSTPMSYVAGPPAQIVRDAGDVSSAKSGSTVNWKLPVAAIAYFW